MTVSAVRDDDLRDIISTHASLEGPMLPILHAIQSAYGCIPEAARALIAEALNITKAEVHGVISFYHDFRDHPAGKHTLKICRAEACQSVGADVLAESTLKKLGLDWHETSSDGNLTVEPVYCLGLCACGPAVMMDERLVARADDTKIDALIQGAKP